MGPMGPISCDRSDGFDRIDHDRSYRFDGIDFDNGAKSIGTETFGASSMGLDRCGANVRMFETPYSAHLIQSSGKVSQGMRSRLWKVEVRKKS